jgi:ABC-type sugar transport system substrate-binding protein
MSEPLKISIFLRSLDNDYQTLLRESCRVAARRHQFSLREVSAHNDSDRQVSQIRECLAEPEAIRPRALIVFPVMEVLLRPVAEAAARLGVAFVILNRPWGYLEELRRQHPKVPLFSVMPDQKDIGRIQGQQFRWLLRRRGLLLYITGTSGTASAELRLEGMKRELTDVEAEIVVEPGDWSMASGVSPVENWLRNRGAETATNLVVGAQNDSMAMGARSALVSAAVAMKHPELADVPVTGCDGTPTYGLELVTTRELAATVVVPPTTDRAVDELAHAFSTGRVPTADISLGVTSFPDLAEVGAATRASTKLAGRRPAQRPR